MDQAQENKDKIEKIDEDYNDFKLEVSVALATIITQNEAIFEKISETKDTTGKNTLRIVKLEHRDGLTFKKTVQVMAIIGSIAVSLIAIGGLL